MRSRAGSDPAHIPCQMSAGSAYASSDRAQAIGRSGKTWTTRRQVLTVRTARLQARLATRNG